MVTIAVRRTTILESSQKTCTCIRMYVVLMYCTRMYVYALYQGQATAANGSSGECSSKHIHAGANRSSFLQ
jgi:hypothetical protein